MNADSTHTIRLPAGVAKRLVAATGQPLSTVMRFVAMSLLAKYEAQGRPPANPKQVLAGDVASIVAGADLPQESGQ